MTLSLGTESLPLKYLLCTQEKVCKQMVTTECQKRAVDRQVQELESLAEASNAAWAVTEGFLKEVTSEQNWSEEARKSISGRNRRVRLGCGGGESGIAGNHRFPAMAGNQGDGEGTQAWRSAISIF